MAKFVGLRAKTYSSLIDNSSEDIKEQEQIRVSSNKNLSLKIIKTV